jgi:hypothetical protein
MKSAARLLLALAVSLPAAALAQTPTEPVTMHATGQFDVKVSPQTPDNPQAKASGLARLSLDKQFHGDLDATSQGEMLAAGDGSTSGAYVALETVSGKLHGRSGRPGSGAGCRHGAGGRQRLPPCWPSSPGSACAR